MATSRRVRGERRAAWDGQIVKLVPLTPEDPNPDLEQQLAALHALGPMEFEPGETCTNHRGAGRTGSGEQRGDGSSAESSMMNRYLLDTNHLSAYLDRQSTSTEHP